MAKRSTTLGPKKKSVHSRKTKKRLAVKQVMLAAKAAKKIPAKKAAKKTA